MASNFLERAGYFEGRNVDISDILCMYEKYGYSYTEAQKAFLKKYAYLDIPYKHPIWENVDMTLRINPIEAQKSLDMEVVEIYNVFFKDELLLIGEIVQEHLSLFLSKQGYFITAIDDCAVNWGNSFETMICNIVSTNKREFLFIHNF